MDTFEQNDTINTQTIDRPQETYMTNNTRSYPYRRPEYPYIRRDNYRYGYRRYDQPIRRLPNKAFDQEYMTEWAREVKFLHEKGIDYTYVKRTPDYGVSQFKYKKTPALFEALKEFYSQVESEKDNLADADKVQEVLKSAGITIRKGRNGAIKFIKDSEEDVTE